MLGKQHQETFLKYNLYENILPILQLDEWYKMFNNINQSLKDLTVSFALLSIIANNSIKQMDMNVSKTVTDCSHQYSRC